MEIIEKRNGLLNSNNWKLQYFTLSNLQNDILYDTKSTNIKDLSNTINQSELTICRIPHSTTKHMEHFQGRPYVRP